MSTGTERIMSHPAIASSFMLKTRHIRADLRTAVSSRISKVGRELPNAREELSMLRLSWFRTASVRYRATQFLLVVAVVFVLGDMSAQTIDRNQFEVIGLMLMKNEVSDLERTLGGATAFRSRDSHFSERCYASEAKDGTVVVFEDWAGTLVGFRIYHSSLKATENCTRTPAVSPQLSTAGGLRLGLTKAEVLSCSARLPRELKIPLLIMRISGVEAREERGFLNTQM